MSCEEYRRCTVFRLIARKVCERGAAFPKDPNVYSCRIKRSAHTPEIFKSDHVHCLSLV